MKQDPKSMVLQEIMDLMDDQMLSKFKKPAAGEETESAEELPEAPTEESADDEGSHGIDAETLRKLIEMNGE